MSQLFQRKPIAALVEDTLGEHSLKRSLGAGDLIMLAIGAVIGAGIFGAIGTAAAGQIGPNGEVIRQGAGPALVFSFLLLGGACALAGLCYAELAAMIPQAGSAYAYSYATLGELVAWIIGWDLILEYAVGNVAVAISWGDYFTTLLRNFGVDSAVMWRGVDIEHSEFDWRSQYPNLAGFSARVETRPSFAATVPVPQKISDKVV